MKVEEQTIYECECCGFKSLNKDKVIECENKHRGFESFRFLREKYDYLSPYPYALQFCDGDKEVVYVLHR